MNPVEFELQHRKIWLGIGYILLVGVAVSSLIPVSAPAPEVSDPLLHFLTYALLSGWFSLIVKRPGTLWAVLLGLITFGLLMEFLQGLTGYRMREIGDAIANSLGVLVGLVCHFSPLRRVLMKVDHYLNSLI